MARHPLGRPGPRGPRRPQQPPPPPPRGRRPLAPPPANRVANPGEIRGTLRFRTAPTAGNVTQAVFARQTPTHAQRVRQIKIIANATLDPARTNGQAYVTVTGPIAVNDRPLMSGPFDVPINTGEGTGWMDLNTPQDLDTSEVVTFVLAALNGGIAADSSWNVQLLMR